MNRRFLLVSGLPGSGKTTVGRRLAPILGLPLLDKDDILDSLLVSKGAGDEGWRRSLSRESDVLLETAAAQSNGAVLVSFWRLPGMPPDSGTPVDWLLALPGAIVNLRCRCPAEVAAARFVKRKRHPGHLDGCRSYEEVLSSLEALVPLGQLAIGEPIDVDTVDETDCDALALEVRDAFARCLTRRWT